MINANMHNANFIQVSSSVAIHRHIELNLWVLKRCSKHQWPIVWWGQRGSTVRFRCQWQLGTTSVLRIEPDSRQRCRQSSWCRLNRLGLEFSSRHKTTIPCWKRVRIVRQKQVLRKAVGQKMGNGLLKDASPKKLEITSLNDSLN